MHFGYVGGVSPRAAPQWHARAPGLSYLSRRRAHETAPSAMLLRWPSETPDLARPGCGHGWLAKLEQELCAGWEFVDAEDPRWLDLMLLLHARPHLRTTLVVPEEVASLTWDELVSTRASGPKLSTRDCEMIPILNTDSEDNYDRVIILIQAGVCAEAYDESGATLLLMACQEGWTDIVEALAENGSDLDKPLRESGDTPLFKAAEHNHLDIMEILLSHRVGANSTYRSDALTPLGVACAMAVSYTHLTLPTILLV